MALNEIKRSESEDCECKFCQTTLTKTVPELKREIGDVVERINKVKDGDHGSVLDLPGYIGHPGKSTEWGCLDQICRTTLDIFRLSVVQFDEDNKRAVESKFIQKSINQVLKR